MRRSKVLFVSMRASTLWVLLINAASADSPLPPPALQTIRSANQQFFAVMDPDKQITTVFKMTKAGHGEKLWSMYGWFRDGALADDGEHLIACYGGGNLIPIAYDKQQVMLYFFKRGELINFVTLDKLILDQSKLRRTASHYFWGHYKGLDRTGHYVIETVEGRKIRFDVTKGIAVP